MIKDEGREGRKTKHQVCREKEKRKRNEHRRIIKSIQIFFWLQE